MAHDHPIQNSEVYLLTSTHTPSNPPPSPPSPATPCDSRALSPCPDDLLRITTAPSSPNLCPTTTSRLTNCIHVLETESTALSSLTNLYSTSASARLGFSTAISAILQTHTQNGKLIITGVGKSGHIAKKLVATMNSLKIPSTYLHPTEALHGDLGKVSPTDTILLITFSGKTPELLALLPHFDERLPVIVMTGNVRDGGCEILKRRRDAILLPAPVHLSETESFGFNAPTTSTTVALALGDALAVVVAQELHLDVQAVFERNHPGGAIGAAASSASLSSLSLSPPTKTIGDLAVKLSDLEDLRAGKGSETHDLTAAHVLMAAYKSAKGWVRHGDSVVSGPRRVKRLRPEEMGCLIADIHGLCVQRKEWVKVPSDMDIVEAREWVDGLGDDVVVVVVQAGKDIGLLEVGDLKDEEF